MYGLTRLAIEVARVLPNGEKNALRKTYKGHIKKLGVQGHFDEVKEDPYRPDGLISLMKTPQDVWDVHFTRGRRMKDGLSEEVRQVLPRAMTMGKSAPVGRFVDDETGAETGYYANQTRQPAYRASTAGA
jgi:hypothetical protein